MLTSRICYKYVICLLGHPNASSEGLMFYCRCFFLLLPRDLRAASADRRETLPYDRNVCLLYNASQKIRGPSPQRNWGQKHAKFGTISDNFRLRARISPERDKISKIGKRCLHRRFLPRSTESPMNFGPLTTENGM